MKKTIVFVFAILLIFSLQLAEAKKDQVPSTLPTWEYAQVPGSSSNEIALIIHFHPGQDLTRKDANISFNNETSAMAIGSPLGKDINREIWKVYGVNVVSVRKHQVTVMKARHFGWDVMEQQIIKAIEAVIKAHSKKKK
jgi:hypothetical protein